MHRASAQSALRARIRVRILILILTLILIQILIPILLLPLIIIIARTWYVRGVCAHDECARACEPDRTTAGAGPAPFDSGRRPGPFVCYIVIIIVIIIIIIIIIINDDDNIRC